MKAYVPWAMVLLRIVLCPAVAVGADRSWDGRWLGGIVLLALLDDIYDGVLARRWKCNTANLRRADSAADTIFYLGVLAALWIRDQEVLRQDWSLLAVLAVLEVGRHAFDRFKYGRAASYHSYLAKAWGLVMAIGVISLLSFGGPRWLIWFSVLIGIVADAEGFLMSLLLPEWQNDVKSVPAALRLRRDMLARRADELLPLR